MVIYVSLLGILRSKIVRVNIGVLWIELLTYGVTFPLFSFVFWFNFVPRSNNLALSIPALIRVKGHFCLLRNNSSTFVCFSKISGFVFIILRHQESEKGMLHFVCLGWQELNLNSCRYPISYGFSWYDNLNIVVFHR